MEEKVKEVLNLIRPSLQNDGGDVEFVSLDGKKDTVQPYNSGNSQEAEALLFPSD